jgi:hypothetical protein
MPCWKKSWSSWTVLPAWTVKVAGSTSRPPFLPARVKTCPTEKSGVAGSVASATSVRRSPAAGAAPPPTTVRGCEVRMEAPEATMPLALRLPLKLAFSVALALVRAPRGMVTLSRAPGMTLKSVSTPNYDDAGAADDERGHDLQP